jgi:HEAT repeat protein
LLCQEHQAAVVPPQIEWLKDVSEDVRASAAFNLCWLPGPDAVPGLLDALKVEKTPRVRGQMLQALAQTGDKRGLDALLAAAAEDWDETTLTEIVRGLARVRDKRALPILADLASRPKASDGFTWEVVNAFGYVSGLYKAGAPNHFWSSGGPVADEFTTGRAVIDKWRAEQKPPK